MRQLAMQRGFFKPSAELSAGFDARVVDLNHLMMLAISRAMSPPITHMRNSLQPMRVIVIEPQLIARAHSNADIGADDTQLLPLALPQTAPAATYPESPLQHRLVQGEILSDEGGRLYEKVGHQIRPIRQLASSPLGQLIDLVPTEQTNVRTFATPAQPAAPEAVEVAPPQNTNGRMDGSNAQFIALQRATEKSTNQGFRKLFADPGQWRIVKWIDFKEILSPQLAHPERLRSTYQLPSYVQVYEIERPMSVEELAAACSVEPRQTSLYFLTTEIATNLELVALLPPQPAALPNVQRAPNMLLPQDRVFRLVVANDPTVDVGSPKSKTKVSSGKSNNSSLSDNLNEQASSNSMTLKQSIPAQFLNDWEFKVSREEVLYDVAASSGVIKAIRNLMSRLRVFKVRRELRKWEALLAGKSADEQLWVVRPPAVGNAFIRDWAKRTLAAAGYDVEKMLSEWDIFWRRKTGK